MPTPTPTTPEPRSAATARPHRAERPIGSRCRPDCRPPVGNQTHCTVCHHTMTGVTYFDAHRRDGRCTHPTDLGLTERDRLWSTPEGHDNRMAKAARLAAHRATAEETTR